MRKPLSKKRLREIRHTVAANVRWQRLQQGLSQDALARAAGVHRTYVSLVERALLDPSLGSLYRLAWALHVAIPKLLRPRKFRLGRPGGWPRGSSQPA